MRFVSFFLLSLLSLPAFAETFVSSALAIHEGIEHGIERQRRIHRTDTELSWDRSNLVFPCREAIEKARKDGKLPTITLNGERHDAPYCSARTTLLTARVNDPKAPICLAHEQLDAGERTDKGVSGLEDPDLKALTLLLSAFNDATRRNVAKRQGKETSDVYGGASGLLDVMIKPSVRRLWKDNLDQFRRDFPEAKTALGLLSQATIEGKGAIGAKDEKFWTMAVREQSATVAPILRKLTALLVKDIEDRMKDGRFQGETAPKGLGLEVALALREIEKSAERPDDVRAMEATTRMTDYLAVSWRDRIMAKNLAELYCENLKAAKPKPELQAVVGQLHVPGLARILAEPAKAQGISVFAVNGNALADRFQWLIGEPDRTTGRYADQGVVLERNDGKPFALSKQIGGTRITVLLDSADPIPGMPLNGALSVRVWGPDGALQEHLGLDKTKPVPTADLIRIASEMREHYQPKKK